MQSTATVSWGLVLGLTTTSCRAPPTQAFLQAEQLGEGDSWFCGRCKAHVQAQKKLDLWRVPELLVVLIKRFEHTRSGRVKLDAPVSFPLEGLDLTPYLAHAQARALNLDRACWGC